MFFSFTGAERKDGSQGENKTVRLKAGVLHLFQRQAGAGPCSDSNPRAGGKQQKGILRVRGRSSGLICPGLMRWWEAQESGVGAGGGGTHGKGCTSWLPLLGAGFLDLHLRNCFGTASSLSSEQQPGVRCQVLATCWHCILKPNAQERGLVTSPTE